MSPGLTRLTGAYLELDSVRTAVAIVATQTGNANTPSVSLSLAQHKEAWLPVATVEQKWMMLVLCYDVICIVNSIISSRIRKNNTSNSSHAKVT